MDKKTLKKVWEAEPVALPKISKKMELESPSAYILLQDLRKAGLVALLGDSYVVTENGKVIIGFPKIDEQMLGKIMRKVPQENAFYFYTMIDQPLGIYSDNIIDFCEKIRSIDIRSIEFHMARGDFESWINYLGDIELAERLKLVKETTLTGEVLREKIYAVLKSRCDELLKEKSQ